MTYLLLNTAFETVGDIDNFDSMIWTDRYYAYGDFQLYLAASTAEVAKYKKDYYVWSDFSNELMIVDTSEVKESEEGGMFLTVSGDSATFILDRRIIWSQTTLQGNFQAGIKRLLTENAINPSDPNRRIPNLTFRDSTDPAVTNETIDEQFLGDNLYTVIANLCKVRNLGFRIVGTEGSFVFELYAGDDRSYNQDKNPWVTFSPDLDNLTSSRYVHSKSTLKTMTLVGGEGEWPNKTFVTTQLSGGGGAGLARRELYTESGLASKIGDQQLSAADYQRMLVAKGKMELLNHRETMSFDGEVAMLPTFEYNIDFFLGDIIQMQNEFKIESTSRVVEFIWSDTPTGKSAYPTLESVDL